MDAATAARGSALLINLTRFGDLLQSQPLVESLHGQGWRVHLLCLDNFSKALPLLRHVERAWHLPGGSLLSGLEGDWRRPAARLLELVRTIGREVRPGLVVNLTTTLPARLLAGLLGREAGMLRGFFLDGEGFGCNRGLWASFLSGTTASRLSAPFNLVDMFRMLGAPDAPSGTPPLRLASPSPEALAAADGLLAAAPEGCRGFVAMQLGASEARRQWPAEHFAAVGDRLWQEERLCPVLLGTQSEAPLAEACMAAAQGPSVPAAGRTSLPQLAALLSRCRLLVTNDTGTMHLAAGMGIPSLALFLATAQPCDTGPYLPGCCCLEPALPCHPCPYNSPCGRDLACMAHISPRSVAALALAWLRTGSWEAAPLADIESEARVWLTERDERGFAVVRRLSALPPDDRSLWMAHQRVFWRQFLDELDGMPAASRMPASPAGYSGAFVQRVGAAMEQAARLCALLTEQGRLLGRSALAGQHFLRNCDRLQSTLSACPELRALGGFWRELRQERGNSMDSLLALTAAMAAHLGAWSEFFKNGMSFA